MDTWSNTCRKCDWCGMRYAPRMQNTRYKGKDFCSFKCKEDWIDADNAVNGTGNDNPQRDLYDWSFNRI
jgi:hypothetical protein